MIVFYQFLVPQLLVLFINSEIFPLIFYVYYDKPHRKLIDNGRLISFIIAVHPFFHFEYILITIIILEAAFLDNLLSSLIRSISQPFYISLDST